MHKYLLKIKQFIIDFLHHYRKDIAPIMVIWFTIGAASVIDSLVWERGLYNEILSRVDSITFGPLITVSTAIIVFGMFHKVAKSIWKPSSTEHRHIGFIEQTYLWFRRPVLGWSTNFLGAFLFGTIPILCYAMYDGSPAYLGTWIGLFVLHLMMALASFEEQA